MSETSDLAATQAAFEEAKAAYIAAPTPDNYAAHQAALHATREARWVSRGGLDNPYGATTYAEYLDAARAARKGE